MLVSLAIFGNRERNQPKGVFWQRDLLEKGSFEKRPFLFQFTSFEYPDFRESTSKLRHFPSLWSRSQIAEWLVQGVVASNRQPLESS